MRKQAKRQTRKAAEGTARSIDDVYGTLKELVISGQFPPGSRLGESEAMRKLGISRSWARRAIERLASEGFVELVKGRGAIVTELSKQTVIEWSEVREALEALAVRLACSRASESDLARLHECVVGMKQAIEAYDLLGYSQLNDKFHGLLIDMVSNKKLSEIYYRINVQMRRFRFQSLLTPGRAKQSLAEHEAILEALQTREVDRAEEAIRTHIRNVGSNVMSALDNSVVQWMSLMPGRQ